MPNFDLMTPGSPLQIPAATYNELLAMLIWWRGLNVGPRDPVQRTRELDTILIKNGSGEDLSTGHVLGLDEPLYLPEDDEDEFKTRWRMKGVMPQRETHYRKFAVLLEAAADGDLVEAAVDGLVMVLLDVADEHHTHADVVDDETLLQTGVCGGAKIIWKEEGAGEKWALVRLGAPQRTAFAKATSSIAAITGETPTSGEVTEWVWDGGELVETELAFDGYNASTAEVSADGFLTLKEIGYKMVIDAAAGTSGDEIVEGTADGDFLTGDSVVDVSVDGDSEEVSNPLKYPMGNGDKVLLRKRGSEFLVIGVEQVAYTVQTNDQVDGVNKKLQLKSRTIRTARPGTESGWTDYHTGDEC